jgi:hypothetical protein
MVDPLTLAGTAVTFLAPYLVKAGEKAAEEVGKRLPDAPAKIWQAIMARFAGKPVAEEAVKDIIANPDDADNQAGFRKELRKVLEADATFAAELERLLAEAQRQRGGTISNTGSGAVATSGGVAAGAGGAAIKGSVQGGIHIGGSEKKG